jgi:hypothetical protein
MYDIYAFSRQAIGGLIVAVVVKYADNILKGFASSFSIVTSMLLCYWLFDLVPNRYFSIGAVLVLVSMYMYSMDTTTNTIAAPSKVSGPLHLSRVDQSSSSAAVAAATDRLHLESQGPLKRSEVLL